MSIDPKDVRLLASLHAPIQGGPTSDALKLVKAILTSTDPAVHAALLAALVRAGVLDCEASGGPVEPEGKRRYVTDWEETCD